MFTETETFQRLCNLPRLNPNVTRLLSLSVSPDANLDAFENLFSSDPSLAAEVLRVSNSAEFGQMSRVISISRALLLLGEERVRKLSVTIAMRQYTRHSPARAEVQALWSHSLASAVLAEEVGKAQGFPPEHLYT